jgi:hypothetical protein
VERHGAARTANEPATRPRRSPKERSANTYQGNPPVITEAHDEQLAAPAQDHLTSAVHDLERLTRQLDPVLADPELERWPGAPALSTPHSRRSAQS